MKGKHSFLYLGDTILFFHTVYTEILFEKPVNLDFVQRTRLTHGPFSGQKSLLLLIHSCRPGAVSKQSWHFLYSQGNWDPSWTSLEVRAATTLDYALSLSDTCLGGQKRCLYGVARELPKIGCIAQQPFLPSSLRSFKLME